MPNSVVLASSRRHDGSTEDGLFTTMIEESSSERRRYDESPRPSPLVYLSGDTDDLLVEFPQSSGAHG